MVLTGGKSARISDGAVAGLSKPMLEHSVSARLVRQYVYTLNNGCSCRLSLNSSVSLVQSEKSTEFYVMTTNVMTTNRRKS